MELESDGVTAERYLQLPYVDREGNGLGGWVLSEIQALANQPGPPGAAGRQALVRLRVRVREAAARGLATLFPTAMARDGRVLLPDGRRLSILVERMDQSPAHRIRICAQHDLQAILSDYNLLDEIPARGFVLPEKV